MLEYNIARPEASKILWVSLRSIDRYALNWRLKYKKIKWRVLFSEQDLLDLKIQKNTEVFDEEKTSFDFRKNRVENETFPIINTHKPAEREDNHGLVDFVKAQAERDLYKAMYEATLNDLKQKQEDLERINFKIWELSASQDVPLLENKKSQEIAKDLKNKLVENEKQILDLKDELSFQRFIKWVFVWLSLITIMILSLWYIYTFKI